MKLSLILEAAAIALGLGCALNFSKTALETMDLNMALYYGWPNFVGIVAGPVLFLLSGPISRALDSQVRALWSRVPLVNKKPPAPGPAKWKGQKRRPKLAKPVDWKPGERSFLASLTKRPKFHVPGLRTFKRLAAAVLCAVNFVIGELTLTGPAATQLFALFFLLNSFLLADYIYKTRKVAA